MRHEDFKQVTFAELFAAKSKPVRASGSKIKAAAGFLLLSMSAGVVVAAGVTPLTLAAAGVTSTTLDAWENMPHDLSSIAVKERSIMSDRNGKQIATLFTENRVSVTLEDVSPAMIDALISTEDSRFYEHGSLDAQGFGRALARNTFTGTQEGASTLSQQLVENLRVGAARDDQAREDAGAATLMGKIGELRYATELEREFTKDEILIKYLNTVYLGNGAYGVKAAAARYFSVEPADLTVDQSATLVAMLKSPTFYDPITEPGNSINRRNTVMQRMVSEGNLDQQDYDTLSKNPTPLKESKPKSGCAASDYPYYCSMVLRSMLSAPEFGKTPEEREEFVAQGGLVIRTALDPKAMKSSKQAVDRALSRDNRIAAGVAVIQPGTGQVLGIAQNREYGTRKGQTEILYAQTAQFQPGSTFKPITLATALEQGFDVRTKMSSPSPLQLAGLSAPPGGYVNDTRASGGFIDAYGATKGSVNTWFVRLVKQAGVKETARMANRLGMVSVPKNLSGGEGSITLGAYETSPLQVATVYATFAARGKRCDPVSIIGITRIGSDEQVEVPDGDCHQAILPAVADTVADVLRAPFRSGGTADKLALDGGRITAGKTGTTNSTAATWFAGFTPQAATAVWVGDPRGGNRYPVENITAYGRFIGQVFGGTVAGPIWKDTMNSYLSGTKKRWLPKPKNNPAASLTSRQVPSVVAMRLDEAVTTLRDAGFNVTLDEKRSNRNGLNSPGFVSTQEPKPGSRTGWGETVTLGLTEGSSKNVDLGDE